MSDPVTPRTYVRNLSFSLRRKLSQFLDPHDAWKDVIMCVRKPSGELRYRQHHVRQFEILIQQGKSPTMELLNDWGTSNCTVQDLVDILKSQHLLAAACLLLPEEVLSDSVPVPVSETDPDVTRVIGEDTNAVLHLPQQESVDFIHTSFCSFPYSDLQRITRDFDDRPASDGGSKLGEGGFGMVYKGLLHNKAVAVKKLNPVRKHWTNNLSIPIMYI